jgi:hypothetical protein
VNRYAIGSGRGWWVHRPSTAGSDKVALAAQPSSRP